MDDLRHIKPLIDCDLLRYRCGFAADSQIRDEARRHNPSASADEIEQMVLECDYVDKALQNVKTVMDFLVNEKFSDDYQAFVHGEGNFREQLATAKEYKGNRSDRKPKYFREIKQYLLDVWKAQPCDGQEADDALGIAQCAAPYGTTVICSNDKDMDMIPGYHYNWVTSNFYEVPPEDADMMLFWQMLVGDTSDNIPGIRGIGPKTATNLLKSCGSPMEATKIVRGLYDKEYGDKGWMMAKEIANLLWIRRAPNQECPWI